MIIDNKGKLFGKVSVVDIIVGLLIVGVILGVGYKFTKTRSVVLGKSDNVIIKFYAEESPEYAINAVKVGDVTGDYEKGAVFGKVTSITKDVSKSIGMSSTGEFVLSSKPGYSSAHITVEGQGIFNKDGGLSVNNADYFIGRQIIFKAGNAVFQARVFELTKKE